MSRLALYLLGPPRIELDDEEIHIGRRKALALLAYLAVPGEHHSRDSLATLLWPEYDQSRARADLRRTLSLVNRTLGEGWLTADRETAGLRQAQPEGSGPDLWLDVAQFRQHLAACEMHGHTTAEVCPACLPPLEAAVGLYSDDFLAGFTLRDSLAFDEGQSFQIEGLKDELAREAGRFLIRPPDSLFALVGGLILIDWRVGFHTLICGIIASDYEAGEPVARIIIT